MDGHETPFIWMTGILILLIITFFATIFLVQNANSTSELIKEKQVISAKAFDILQQLSSTQGTPENWYEYKQNFIPGILDKNYNINLTKTNALFNIYNSTFKEIYHIESFNYELLLKKNGQTIKSLNKTIPNNTYPLIANKELTDTITLTLILWEE